MIALLPSELKIFVLDMLAKTSLRPEALTLLTIRLLFSSETTFEIPDFF